MIRATQKIHYDCDVLIVGGGPAGSSLAYHLVTAGIRTIVLEAKQFPRDKICGDGVSPIALRELQTIGITETDGFTQANEIDQVGMFMNGVQAHVALEKPEGLPYHARIIPRITLDAMIYESAKKANAIYYENCRVTDYTVLANKVVITYVKDNKEGQLTAQLVVGADGSRSIIGRRLRGNSPDPTYQLLGLRAYYEGVNGPRNRVDIYFSEENFPGIYWLFPKGERGANVGMAMVFQTFPQQASAVRQCFANHIANNPFLNERLGSAKATEKMQGWPITFYDARNPLIGDRVLLAGEAAGLINPLSGDGIQYALLSARWAAETIVDCLSQNDYSFAALKSYRLKLEKELAYDFSMSNLLVQFGRNKTLTPLWMSLMKRVITIAKDDPSFATTIAGIFEGTYPSYKVLSPNILLKILQQTGLDAQAYLLKNLEHPDQFAKDGALLADGARSGIQEFIKDPKVYLQWLLGIAGKGIGVAAHTAKARAKQGAN
jgi:geranylgeranyl reductase family protein